jgi:hypothetical protein
MVMQITELNILNCILIGAWLLFLINSIISAFSSNNAWHLRILPFTLFLCYFLIEIVPETGWSDIRSQWHRSAALAVYSLLYIILALWLYFGRSTFYRVFALISFIAGASMLAIATFTLNESWYFYHEMLR